MSSERSGENRNTSALAAMLRSGVPGGMPEYQTARDTVVDNLADLSPEERESVMRAANRIKSRKIH